MQLDLSVPHQVWNFVSGALQGDLGVDFTSNEQVTTLVFGALPHTIILAVCEPDAGSAVRRPARRLRGDAPEHADSTAITGVFAVSLITIPPYVAGLFLLLLFAVRLPRATGDRGR